MQAIFKTFNTKTKEVKDYNKPEFGDFGEFILQTNAPDWEIREKFCTQRFTKNTDHELNTIFNGLYKDCVYSNGDLVGVKVRQLNFTNTYKKSYSLTGDVTENMGQLYVLCYGKKPNLEYETFYTIINGGMIYQYDSNDGICYFLSSSDKWQNFYNEPSIKQEYKGNLLDEYFAGGNELAKLCNFN
jgi:hypothetical protein